MEVPSFLNDALFRIVFGSSENVAILKSLLDSVLEFEGRSKIDHLEILSPALDKDTVYDKGCVLDLLCRDGRGQVFNVEVQARRQEFYHRRSFFYAAKAFVEQIQVGESYEKLRKVYSITFCDFTLFTRHSDVHSCFVFSDRAHDQVFSDLVELHYFELGKMEPELRHGSNPWLHVIKYGNRYTRDNLPVELAKEEAILMAMEARQRALSDEQQRLVILSREKFEREDRKSVV